MNRGETAPDEVKFIASIANDFGLAYLHVMRADFFGQQKGDVITPARETLDGPALLVNMGFEVDEAKEGVAAGRFDAVAFGTKFLANPDLPARGVVSVNTVYNGGGAGGIIDALVRRSRWPGGTHGVV